MAQDTGQPEAETAQAGAMTLSKFGAEPRRPPTKSGSLIPTRRRPNTVRRADRRRHLVLPGPTGTGTGPSRGLRRQPPTRPVTQACRSVGTAAPALANATGRGSKASATTSPTRSAVTALKVQPRWP